MAEGVTAADLRRLIAVIEAARSGQAADGLPAAVLEQARDLVRCDMISFTEFDPARRRDYLDQSLPAHDGEPDRRSGATTGNACRAVTPTAAATC